MVPPQEKKKKNRHVLKQLFRGLENMTTGAGVRQFANLLLVEPNLREGSQLRVSRAQHRLQVSKVLNFLALLNLANLWADPVDKNVLRETFRIHGQTQEQVLNLIVLQLTEKFVDSSESVTVKFNVVRVSRVTEKYPSSWGSPV